MNVLLVFVLLTLEALLSVNAFVIRPNSSAWPIVRAVSGLIFLALSLRSIASRRSQQKLAEH